MKVKIKVKKKPAESPKTPPVPYKQTLKTKIACDIADRIQFEANITEKGFGLKKQFWTPEYTDGFIDGLVRAKELTDERN